ncbi:hypothetical protein JL721_9433 [Aureococcus anophagefferens]|nr:hypothetical protein JL721_9433 [Aureococcus anophagefferens]
MRVFTLLAVSCTTSRALLPPSSFAPARRASLLKSQNDDGSRPEKREEVPIQSSVNPAGPLPVEIQLRIAKERYRTAADGSKKNDAELELSKLELAHPELALMQVASERARTEKGFESWRWGKMAEEVQRVSSALKIAAVPLDATLPSHAHTGGLLPRTADDASSKAAKQAEARSRSHALSELQYWALRGNRRGGRPAPRCRACDALKKKDAEGALKGFAAAAGRSRDIDEGKGFADAHRWIGITLDKALGDDVNAQAAFEEALDASPHNYVVMMDLGKLLLKRAARAKAAAGPDKDARTIAAWLGGAPSPAADAAEEKLEKRARLYFERATSLNPALATDVRAVLAPAESFAE